MKKIVFIIPFFGGGSTLPSYFQLWLETCRKNPSVDFLIFTDDSSMYDYPENVKVNYMKFCDIKDIIQRHYEFSVMIKNPYKLCDFRPAYGEIFSDYLAEYEYWGHCDLDLIWGDIRKFITDDILESYDRFFSRGHCSIYKNSLEVNTWYRTLLACGCQDWKDVFQNERSCCFDEWAGHCGGGISEIMNRNHIKIYDEVCMADINVSRGKFVINRLTEYKDIYFAYKNGTLEMKSTNNSKEVLCAHFQKRRVDIEEKLNYSEFYLVAPNYVTSDVNKIKSHVLEEKLFEVKYWVKRVQNKIKKVIGNCVQ